MLLLFVATPDVGEEERARISEAIVASGCRYVVCYGHACSSWDDSIDLAAVVAGKDDSSFIMTTWHEDETPKDVVFFFWMNTFFDGFVPERMGVFILGSEPEVERGLEDEIARYDEREGAID